MQQMRRRGIDPNITRKFGANYASVYQTREDLLQKIKVIEQRLSIGVSEPLQQYLNELMKEDVQLSCRLIELSCSDS